MQPMPFSILDKDLTKFHKKQRRFGFALDQISQLCNAHGLQADGIDFIFSCCTCFANPFRKLLTCFFFQRRQKTIYNLCMTLHGKSVTRRTTLKVFGIDIVLLKLWPNAVFPEAAGKLITMIHYFIFATLGRQGLASEYLAMGFADSGQ